jgi:hypothetical protein
LLRRHRLHLGPREPARLTSRKLNATLRPRDGNPPARNLHARAITFPLHVEPRSEHLDRNQTRRHAEHAAFDVRDVESRRTRLKLERDSLGPILRDVHARRRISQPDL